MNVLRRSVRILGVLAINGFVVSFTVQRLDGPLFGSDPWDFQISCEFILEMLLPVFGFLAELLGWKFAKRVNIGYLLAAGFFWLTAAALWLRNVWSGVFFIASFFMFVLAGLTEILYRRTGTLDGIQPQPS